MKHAWVWLMWVLLAACVFTPQRGGSSGGVFVPPARSGAAPLSPTATAPAGHPTAAPPAPSRPVACTNNLAFVKDETVPDNTVVTAGEAVDKRWRVRNAGTCNWDTRYRLKHIAGDLMGAPAEVALFPARAGAEAVIRMVFTAPEKPGPHFSTWQAYDPQGRPFGDPIYIQIIVKRAPATPTP